MVICQREKKPLKRPPESACKIAVQNNNGVLEQNKNGHNGL